MNKTKFAIGCLVQWYEVDIIGEYIETLKEAIGHYDGEVIVDVLVSYNRDLEKPVSSDAERKIKTRFSNIDYCERSTSELVTIADYRREFNDKFCEQADVLVWGESDMLVPKQAFVILDQLHQMSLQRNAPKYLATFGICKMWDDTWKPLEHPDFTDKMHSNNKDDWWSLNYTMTKDEMNEINDRTDEVDLRVLPQHKFNGCGLVISSEVIKSGVNIPKSVFFVHEDTAFMWMTSKILGNIPQYVIKNILLVHNRKNLKKRAYIKNEAGNSIGQLRSSNKWYEVANKMCQQNYHNLFNPKYKSYRWEDVWNSIK